MKGQRVDDGPGVEEDIGLDRRQTSGFVPEAFGIMDEHRDVVVSVGTRVASDALPLLHFWQ